MSADNPADILSRGATPKELIKSDIGGLALSGYSMMPANGPPRRHIMKHLHQKFSRKRKV